MLWFVEQQQVEQYSHCCLPRQTLHFLQVWFQIRRYHQHLRTRCQLPKTTLLHSRVLVY